MANLLKWDQTGERTYETGTSKGVLFVSDGNGGFEDGVAWNGLTACNETPSGGEPNAIYADNIKYLNLLSAEEFGATIEAYTTPDEFSQCDGTWGYGVPGLSVGAQKKKPFGFCFRSEVGNDTESNDYGYKLHFIYNALCNPSERSYATVNESPEAMTLSYEVTTTPIDFADDLVALVGTLPTGITKNMLKPTAHIVVDSTKTSQSVMTALEEIIYGTAATTGTDPTPAVPARLPMPAEIISIMMGASN